MAINVQKLSQILAGTYPEAVWTPEGLQWNGAKIPPDLLALFWDNTGSVEGVAAAIRQDQAPLTDAERTRLWPHLLATATPLEADALVRPVVIPGFPVFAQLVLTVESAEHWTVLAARRVPAGVDPADLWREAEARLAAAIPLPTTVTTLPTGAVIVSWDDPAAADYAWAFAQRVDEAIVGIPASVFGAVILDPTPTDVGVAFRWVSELYHRYQTEWPAAHPVAPMPLYLVHGALPSNPWAALTPTP
jgi:hypothetical protein